MENEVMNVEVMENDEVMENEVIPVAEVFDDETSESDLSKRDMVIGGVVLGLAAAGAVALGRCVFKGSKAVIKKIKDRVTKKEVVNTPVTEEINEQPVEVTMPEAEQVEVVNETE